MANSWARDLAMSTSTNVGTGMTYALILGCDERDVKMLTDWVRITSHSAGHLMLLPALFFELQLKRHVRLSEVNWSKLVTLCARTGQYGERPTEMQSVFPEEPVDYAETTRQVLGLYQDTGFLAKDLLKAIKALRMMAKILRLNASTVPNAVKKAFIVSENNRIEGRLDEMMDHYGGLIAECKQVADGASLLNQAVSLNWT